MTTALNAPAGKIAQSVLYSPSANRFPRVCGQIACVCLAICADRQWQFSPIGRIGFMQINESGQRRNCCRFSISNDLDDKDAFWGGLPAISVSLCQLVLSNEELFPNLVDIILPCLTKTDDLLYHHYFPLSDNIAQKHPHQMLNLLYKVLPDETLTWPYDIEDILASIGEGEPTLRTNEKFLELKAAMGFSLD